MVRPSHLFFTLHLTSRARYSPHCPIPANLHRRIRDRLAWLCGRHSQRQAARWQSLFLPITLRARILYFPLGSGGIGRRLRQNALDQAANLCSGVRVEYLG